MQGSVPQKWLFLGNEIPNFTKIREQVFNGRKVADDYFAMHRTLKPFSLLELDSVKMLLVPADVP